MAIQIDVSDSKPALNYDKVFLVSLTIRQNHSDDDLAPPIFKVVIKYRTFAVDDFGKRHYSGNGIQTVVIDDYLGEGQVKAMQGDLNMLTAFASIQAALATILSDQLGTTTTVI